MLYKHYFIVWKPVSKFLGPSLITARCKMTMLYFSRAQTNIWIFGLRQYSNINFLTNFSSATILCISWLIKMSQTLLQNPCCCVFSVFDVYFSVLFLYSAVKEIQTHMMFVIFIHHFETVESQKNIRIFI